MGSPGCRAAQHRHPAAGSPPEDESQNIPSSGALMKQSVPNLLLKAHVLLGSAVLSPLFLLHQPPTQPLVPDQPTPPAWPHQADSLFSLR